ncbi:hypothetical protein GCM10023238_37280 [Streptomyces heliomycini]
MARLAAAHGVTTVERARLTAELSGRQRQCLTKGGVWVLTLDGPVRRGGTLHAAVVPAPDAGRRRTHPVDHGRTVPPSRAGCRDVGTVTETRPSCPRRAGRRRGHGRGTGQARRAGGTGRLPRRN